MKALYKWTTVAGLLAMLATGYFLGKANFSIKEAKARDASINVQFIDREVLKIVDSEKGVVCYGYISNPIVYPSTPYPISCVKY